jgi:hypothetical protein
MKKYILYAYPPHVETIVLMSKKGTSGSIGNTGFDR